MKKIYKILALLFVFALTINLSLSKTTNNNSYKEKYDDKYYYTQAQLYFRNDSILRAQEYLSSALKINPKNSEALYMQGNINMHYGKYSDALKNYNLAIKYSKNAPYMYYTQRSLCNIVLKNYKKALKDLIQMREMSKGGPLKNDDSLLYLICGIIEARSVGENIALPIQEIPTKDGYYTLVYTNNYKITSLTKKEYEIICKNLDEAIKTYPKNPIYYTLRAICALKANRKDLALIDLNKAIDINPVFYPAIVERANLYYENSNFKESIRDYQRVNAGIPNNYYIIWRIGENYLELNEYNKARSCFNLSLQKANKSKYTKEDIEIYIKTIKKMVEHQTKEREYADIIAKLNIIIREYNNSQNNN